jgi:membrane protein YdbS with pleckstrin-like domain
VIRPLERAVVRLFRVPPAPSLVVDPSPDTRVFRASRGYLRRRLLGWVIQQVFSVIGILLFLAFTGAIDIDLPVEVVEALEEENIDWLPFVMRERMYGLRVFDLIGVLETFGIITFVLSLPITLSIVVLDYRMRWYVLTDRSLHLRSGIRNVKEQRLTFANVQNVRMEQGPIDRLFGIATVKGHTAGGGAGESTDGKSADQSEEEALHVGWLRGLADAETVRDRILAAVRHYRDAGLGGPERIDLAVPAVAAPAAIDTSATEAARDLLNELRDWRSTLRTP